MNALSTLLSVTSIDTIEFMHPSLFILSETTEFQQAINLSSESFNKILELSLTTGISLSDFVYISS